MRIFPLMLAIGLVAPSPARGRAAPSSRRVEPRQWPRMDARTIRSPSGRHVLEIADGVIALNGLPVHVAAGIVQLIGNPVWRADSDAVAWIERRLGETRLVVLPTVEAGTVPLEWVLPPTSEGDRVHWAGAQRIVVGPVIVEPRAVASWSEGAVR